MPVPGPRYEPARECAYATARRRLEWIRLTEPQKVYLEDDSPISLIRGGNQIGKTLALHLDIIWTARGTHPYQKTPRPPVNIVVLSESWDQMGQVGGFMEKLWSLLPKSEIDPKIQLERGRGITGKPPRIVFTSGPGAGSAITFGTYRQGAARVAGSTIHRVYLDEPPPEHMYAELRLRVLRYGGKLRIGFTPVLDMPDQTWLRQLVEAGEVSDHNPWLQEENCWPNGNPAPFYTTEMIDEVVRTIPDIQRAMRIRGSWEPVKTDRWLSAYQKDLHVRPGFLPPGAFLGVGIDHGTASGKQAAVLFAAIDRDGLRPYVWVFDEVVGNGITSIAQDAAAIHDMLARNGFSWRDVDEWVGDRPTGESRYLIKKSNNQLRRHLAFQANCPLRGFPVIHTPHKWHGSVEHGLHLMNALFADLDEDGTPHFIVNPRCQRFAEFCANFDGNMKDPLKDIGDAGRYIIERAIKEVQGMRLIALY